VTWAALAGLWGFAEATLFFIVPDVPISAVAALAGWRRGVVAALAAALGAMAGGLAMYLWGAADPEAARSAVVALPAIDRAMAEAVARDFTAGGYAAMLAGAFGGIPYKLYAVAAGEQGAPLAAFLVMTPLVRLPRFLLAAFAAAWTARFVPSRARLPVLAVVWIAFYAFYFAVMP